MKVRAEKILSATFHFRTDDESQRLSKGKSANKLDTRDVISKLLERK